MCRENPSNWGWGRRCVLSLATLATVAVQVIAQAGGTWTERMPPPAPPAGNNAMVYDSGRAVCVYFNGTDTWEWNGSLWAKANPTSVPNRYVYEMAYDSARKFTVLFGAGASSNETWEWDGGNWMLRSPATKPSGRYDHAMAYDSARGVTVLFGGYPGAFSNETWEWNGANWSQKSPATSPSPRAVPVMAFDSVRQVCVLFGGYTSSGYNAETWEWNGVNWTLRLPATSPPPNAKGAMAFDSGRGVCVLFGGESGTSPETWEWNGTNWAQGMPATTPSDRIRPGMAFDNAQAVCVLFGGTNNSPPLAEADTWEWNCPSSSISQQPVSQSVATGQAAVFSVTADGHGPFAYNWRKNGSTLSDGGTISGSSSESLIINAATVDDGLYDCLVNAPCIQLISQPAVLFVDSCKAAGSTGDCNGNGVMDSCEIAANPALDAGGAR